MILVDEIAQLIPDLGGGPGIGMVQGSVADISGTSIYRYQVDLAGIPGNIDQVVTGIAISIQISVVYIRAGACRCGFIDRPDRGPKVFGVFDAVIGIGADAMRMIPG